MTARLPASFLDRPIAHRGLHDRDAGRPENSREAAEAAIAAGYGIELDVQLSADGRAMVFHDYHLGRLTAQEGPLRQRSASALAQIALTGGQTGIPTLADFLALVAGRVPLLIEVKDQDGALGPDVGPLEAAVAGDLAGYRGDAAVMSFNPHSVAAMRDAMPEVPRGLVTEAFDVAEWPVPEARLAQLRAIPDYDRVGACFISHDAQDLDRARVAELRAGGATVLCWTIRSPEAEAAARRVAHNVTFEGYAA